MSVEIKQHHCLQDLNSLALPAMAEYFCSASDIEESRQALAFARRLSLAVTPMGGGSNMVLAGDLPGLVLHLNLKGISHSPSGQNQVEVTFAAGENWPQRVQHC